MLAGGAAPSVATDDVDPGATDTVDRVAADVDTRDVDLRTGRRAAAMLAIAGLFVAYVLHAALPASPFTLPGPQARIVKALVPQGWAFFTKSPRSRSVEVFQHRTDGSWQDITSGPRARPGQLMGLDRLGRSQGTELAMLAAVVPEQSWRDCEREPTDCLAEASVAHTVRNRSSHQSVCGEVGLVLQDVLPWAWRDAQTTMPSKVLRVRVQC